MFAELVAGLEENREEVGAAEVADGKREVEVVDWPRDPNRGLEAVDEPNSEVPTDTQLHQGTEGTERGQWGTLYGTPSVQGHITIGCSGGSSTRGRPTGGGREQSGGGSGLRGRLHHVGQMHECSLIGEHLAT